MTSEVREVKRIDGGSTDGEKDADERRFGGFTWIRIRDDSLNPRFAAPHGFLWECWGQFRPQ